jgi:hypothetical protein
VKPGDWVAVCLVAEALLIDVFLLRRGHDPISTCVRRSWLARAAAVALCAHLCTHIPNDPLSRMAGKVSRGQAV